MTAGDLGPPCLPEGEAASTETGPVSRQKFRSLLGGGFRRGVLSTLAASATLLVLGLVQNLVLARTLGPGPKGAVAVAILVGAVFQMVVNPGLAPSFVYFTATRRLDLSVLAGHATSLTALASVASTAFVLATLYVPLIRHLLPGIHTPLLVIAASGVPFGIMVAQVRAMLQGQERLHLMNALTVLNYAVGLALTLILLLVFHTGAWGAVAAYVAGDVVAAAVGVGLLMRDGTDFTPAANWDASRQLLSYGARAHAANFVQFFNYRLDQFALNYLSGTREVGIYTISVRLAELVWQLPNAVSVVILPRAAATDATPMTRITMRAFRWTILITSAAGLFLAIVGKPLIVLLFSRRFAAAYAPMVWLLPGTILFGGAIVLANDLAGRNRPGVNGLIGAVSLSFTVVLDFALIPHFGAVGAAVASTLAYTVTFALTVVLFRRIAGRASADG